MRVKLVAFSRDGMQLASRIARTLEAHGDSCALSGPARIASALGLAPYESLDAWVRDAWVQADALLFVSACGIAVRTVAPLARNKYEDPAVVCVDEAGSFAIPLLSGHVGGANELARRVAAACGAQAAITTATDVRGVFAVDEWATRHNMAILEHDVVKEVSATLLEGGNVGIACDLVAAGTAPNTELDAFMRNLPDGLLANDKTARCGILISLDAQGSPFQRTLHLVPQTVTVGVGCRRDTPASSIAALVDACLEEAHVAPQAVATLATIDVKASEPGLLELCEQRGWQLRVHSADELVSVPGTFCSSEFVRQTVGVDNVCERAACACKETLLLGKHACDGVTVALACGGLLPQMGSSPQVVVSDKTTPKGQPPICGFPRGLVTCVGLGPGAGDQMTAQARKALDQADLIVGYSTYVDLIRNDYPPQKLVRSPMRSEVRRCSQALEQAQAGKRVAVVCSGDPGVYAMAGLVLELAEGMENVEVRVVPGVTAATGGAAILGAPLMHDWCCISLSDLMTPWDAIEKRLEAAAESGMCICLYNPASRGRADHLRKACDVLLRHLQPDTVCGIVQNVGRTGECGRVLLLRELANAPADMRTCVYVGNAQTRIIDGRMVTPRGYANLSRGSTPLDRHQSRGVLPLDRCREILVFGGTSEGRELVEWLDARGTCNVVACTATEYGSSLLPTGARVQSVRGPLNASKKRELMESHDFACIVDATHPFAQHISTSINELARTYGTDVVRIVREEADADSCTTVSSAQEAARYLATTQGNVLLTTGSKDLAAFTEALPHFEQRLYVRVLPVPTSVARVAKLGVPVDHVIAMQGPFSAQLNAALLREVDARYLVTKQSGQAGGFEQKAQAARECGAELVVIRRPQAYEGLLLEQAKQHLEERYGA